MITHKDWIELFPSLEATPQAIFDMHLKFCLIEMGSKESRWSSFYNWAQMYLMAHYITMHNKIADGGGESTNAPVSDRNVDDVRVGYAIEKQKLSDVKTLLLTAFGQEYVRIRRMALAGPRVA